MKDCALGAVNLVQLLRIQSQGTMPVQASGPGGDGLDVERASTSPSRPASSKSTMRKIVKATHIFTNQIFGVLGITPKMLTKAAGAAHGVSEDPAKMEMIRLRAGVVRDPRGKYPRCDGRPTQLGPSGGKMRRGRR